MSVINELDGCYCNRLYLRSAPTSAFESLHCTVCHFCPVPLDTGRVIRFTAPRHVSAVSWARMIGNTLVQATDSSSHQPLKDVLHSWNVLVHIFIRVSCCTVKISRISKVLRSLLILDENNHYIWLFDRMFGTPLSELVQITFNNDSHELGLSFLIVNQRIEKCILLSICENSIGMFIQVNYKQWSYKYLKTRKFHCYIS